MILVTGGTGLVGSHLLLDLVRTNQKVRAIYRSKDSLEAVKKVFSYTYSKENAEKLFQTIDWVVADITDVPSLEEAFEDVRSVYHCAALVSFDSGKDTLLRKTNIEGTANVVNYCIKNKIEKLCFVSSIATLDKKPGEKIISETSHWNKENNHNMYAITKYGSEMEVWRASQEGVSVVIVNPGVILGTGSWTSGSGQIFSRIQKGLNYYVNKVTGFVGVEDVVRVMQQLMASSIENDQFILVSENRSFRSIFEKVATVLEKPAPLKRLKSWMIYSGWFFQGIKSLFTGEEKNLTLNSAKTLSEESFYSNEKISSALNFEFEPIDMVIERTGKRFRQDL